jgi:hypothetical protein
MLITYRGCNYHCRIMNMRIFFTDFTSMDSTAALLMTSMRHGSAVGSSGFPFTSPALPPPVTIFSLWESRKGVLFCDAVCHSTGYGTAAVGTRESGVGSRGALPGNRQLPGLGRWLATINVAKCHIHKRISPQQE